MKNKENKEMYIMSACLVGVACRYDNNSKTNQKAMKFFLENDCILVCPEVLGGLETPRIPCERVNDLVLNKIGEDCTEYFSIGANKVLEICKNLGIEKAILKENSPSCGTTRIYDGSFSMKTIRGMGVLAQLLKNNGITVISDEAL